MILPTHANDGQSLKPFPKDDNSLIYVHVRICFTQSIIVIQRKLLIEYKQRVTMSSQTIFILSEIQLFMPLPFYLPLLYVLSKMYTRRIGKRDEKIH